MNRLMMEQGQPRPRSFNEAVDILHSLTSFETFDGLAGTSRTPEEVEALVQRLARMTLGVDKRMTGEAGGRKKRRG